MNSTTNDESYDQKVLRAFLVEGRIKQIPAQPNKRDVLLRFLIPNFETERVYREAEVNGILGAFHEDVATLGASLSNRDSLSAIAANTRARSSREA